MNALTRKPYLTRSGVPLSIELKWPFRRSSSGADFYFIHADVWLENGTGQHALVAVNLTQTLREVLPSLEPQDLEAPLINALRKEVDNKQLEFTKSPKLVPLQFSSRHYDLRRGRWAFGETTEEQRQEFVLRKMYWFTRMGAVPVYVTDPVDVQYLNTTPEHMEEMAQKLAREDLVVLQGTSMTATPALMEQAARFEADAAAAVQAMEKKHAFERG